ncbi:YfiR/HmsC family protein [Thiorhodococcus minor]|uniref:YfiR family protein n=1 Tax=Thiorhodococcus minor TaxID=57489 RepID=A0A6M0K1Y4_9GAMM|nr:YfiR family protein [Thiorhodococcus minor]
MDRGHALAIPSGPRAGAAASKAWLDSSQVWLRPLWAVLLLIWVSVLPCGALAVEPSREDRIKAAIVYKVGKFVDWPANAFDGAASPLRVCLLGRDAFSDALASIAGRKVQGRSIDFRVIGAASLPRPGDCHILYLPRSASGRVGSVVRNLSGMPILTISDIPGFARSGGMISLVRSGNRIGFEIDPDSARRSGLSVRAQLLDLADIVGR